MTKEDDHRKGTTEGAQQAAPTPPKDTLPSVLESAQGETRRQLGEALEKKKRTGLGLLDILRQDVDREMFGHIWSFLQGPAEAGPAKGAGKGKTVKDVLLEGGWITTQDIQEAQESGEAYDPQLGRVLVEGGHITEEQFQDALAQQERSGQSFWRILVNKGLVVPKQIADARKYGAQMSETSLSDATAEEMLLRTRLVTKDKVEAALEEKKRTGRTLFQSLVDSGAVRKAELGEALAKQMGIAYVDLSHTSAEPEAVQLLPEHLARQHLMIPIAVADNKVRLAMACPQDVAARELFQMMVGMEAEPVLAFEGDVVHAIDRHYGAPEPSEGEGGSALERLKAKLRGAARADESIVSMAESAGIINVVASTIEGAINSRATDIHLEPQTDGLRVRYRIDGFLYDIMHLPAHLQDGVLSRVKVLAGMDITERRHPQDGHFSIGVLGNTYDLRVATLPTVLGEKMVLRLLNPEDVFKGLRELGLEPDQLKTMEDVLAKPYGMVLATGPIGSGKTTTLYAALSKIDILTQNVVTIEDPVEYQLPGINQVQVDTRVDRTFANMLRSVVRQDADVMMVGEIRDQDTAQVAVRAAMTGHLVFSTLHTNDAVGAILALQHLGVAPFLIPSALIAVVAQRLVRRVCPACREETRPAKELLAAAGVSGQAARHRTFYRAVGCEECLKLGYKGRTGIYEVLTLSPAMKELIVQGANHAQLLQQAHDDGMQGLMETGVRKVEAGITTLEELLRVTTA